MTKDHVWLYEDGQTSLEFDRVVEEVSVLLAEEHHTIAEDIKSSAGLIVSQLAHVQGYKPSDFVPNSEWGAAAEDWTYFPGKGSNSSVAYRLCVGIVEEVIKGHHLAILTFKTDAAAHMIVTRLAYEQNLVPPVAPPIIE